MHAGQQPDEKRGTDDRGQDAERDFHLSCGACKCVDQQQVAAAENGRGGQQAREIRADQRAREMWHYQPDPADDAGGGDVWGAAGLGCDLHICGGGLLEQGKARPDHGVFDQNNHPAKWLENPTAAEKQVTVKAYCAWNDEETETWYDSDIVKAVFVLKPPVAVTVPVETDLGDVATGIRDVPRE